MAKATTTDASAAAVEAPVEAPLSPRDERKRELFLNEFASTDARRRAMDGALDEGMEAEAFVAKFFPKSARAAYIARRVKEVN